MKLYFHGHNYKYPAEQMLLTLFPGQRPEYPNGPPGAGEDGLVLSLHLGARQATATAALTWEGRTCRKTRRCPLPDPGDKVARDRAFQHILKLAFYSAGTALLGAEPPWGALTGVRPVKLPTRMLAAGTNEAQVLTTLTEEFRVQPDRAELALTCAKAALDVKESLSRDQLSLYLGIPFCPTRCAYCSFISSDVRGALALVEPYVDALCREIALAGERLAGAGLSLSTAYMGGGTPTTLSAPQLDRVLSAVEKYLPMDRCREFTVEAGRPDTITEGKLKVLRDHGIQRISINPQTMDDRILRSMGRAHTAGQIRQAMELAGAHFGGLVNMDLIAGLPGDSPEGFARTLEEVLAMAPANLTVHTLALKKGARLMEERGSLCSPEGVADMLATARDALSAAGYQPYYLYRQKYMSGSFENVGWCQPGTRCDYNILMMEELQTVFSLGAGGITKLVDPGTGKITRLSNPKYPKEYLETADKLAARLQETVRFQQQVALRG